MNTITRERVEKLEHAAEILAEVQIAMLREDDRLPREARTENWRRLFTIRVDLNHEIYRLKTAFCPHCSHPKHEDRCQAAVPSISPDCPEHPAEVIDVEQCPCGAEDELNA